MKMNRTGKIFYLLGWIMIFSEIISNIIADDLKLWGSGIMALIFFISCYISMEFESLHKRMNRMRRRFDYTMDS